MGGPRFDGLPVGDDTGLLRDRVDRAGSEIAAIRPRPGRTCCCWAPGASFLPVVAVLWWYVVYGTPFPWMISFLGFFLFPLAVGYGIVRRELFDVRLAARSSAAYGAATLTITGVFALLITAATEVFRRLSGDEPSPAISVPFVFMAILAFNPVRERSQALVDRFFDRDRAAYRRAVREISEAMVSMLSAREIVDRILVALTATMGVERALVLVGRRGLGRPAPCRGGARGLGRGSRGTRPPA